MTASRREAALDALQAALDAALDDEDLAATLLPRNTPVAARLDILVSETAKSIVVLVDGDAAPPTALLGDPPIYDHIQVPVVEIISCHPDADVRDRATDAIAQAIDAMLRQDPTLGGVCDLAHALSPDPSVLQEDGAPPAKALELPVELLFPSESELG